jgi:hypothetical protein
MEKTTSSPRGWQRFPGMLGVFAIPALLFAAILLLPAPADAAQMPKYLQKTDTVPPVVIRLSAQPTATLADGVSRITIHGTFTDALAAPIPGIAIGFLVDDGVAIVDPDSVMTDPLGRFTTTVRSSTAGAVTISALGVVTPGIATGIASVNLFFVHPPVTVTLAASPLSIPANSTTQSVITATVRGGDNLPAPGRTITFAAVNGAVSPASGTTDAQGKATTFLTSSSAGNAVLTATPDNGSSAQITITVSNAQNLLPMVQLAPPLPLIQLKNGGFETVGAWVFSRSDIVYPCASLRGSALKSGCGGAKVAWLGGVSTQTSFAMEQAVAMTDRYPVQVTFRYFIESARTSCGPDRALVRFGNQQMAAFTLCKGESSSTWQSASYLLPGSTATQFLRFETLLAGGAVSSFFVDDVALCTTSDFAHPSLPKCP